jgi:Spy/CpxP family protein refolding chaperone
MKNNSYVHVLMAAGAALLLFSTPSMAMEKEHGMGAGPGSMGEERGPEHGKPDFKEAEASLGLTEDQRAKMKTIREESKSQQESLRTELKAKHESLRQELDSANADRGKAEGLVKDISALELKMGLNRVDMIFKIKAVLTPEQYQKLQAFHEKKRAEFKERRGKKMAEKMKK